MDETEIREYFLSRTWKDNLWALDIKNWRKERGGKILIELDCCECGIEESTHVLRPSGVYDCKECGLGGTKADFILHYHDPFLFSIYDDPTDFEVLELISANLPKIPDHRQGWLFSPKYLERCGVH